MRLFSEKVQPTLVNSPLNIIQVESFHEIFFDVYEIEINNVKCPADKISEYNGSPIVSIPVIIEGVKRNYPFVLCEGEFSVIFNEENTIDQYTDDPELLLVSDADEIPVLENIELPVLDEIVGEDYSEISITDISEDRKDEILEQIQEAKRKASEELDKIQAKKVSNLKKQSTKNAQVLEDTLENAKESLVEQFLSISDKIKEGLIVDQDLKIGTLERQMQKDVLDISKALSEDIDDNFADSANKLDKRIRQVVKEIYTKFATTQIKEDVDNIRSDIYSEFAEFRSEDIKLDGKITKGVNKALSRIGNVATRFDNAIDHVNESVDTKISDASDKITTYYNNKLEVLEESLNEFANKDELLAIVNESKNILLENVKTLKGDGSMDFIMESGSPKQKTDLQKFQREFDKKIIGKIDEEVVRMRKYVVSAGGGGGTVAQQFADGGTMNGDLTIVGSISAGEYLGLTALGDYLPLSGGTLTGPLTANDIYADNVGIGTDTPVAPLHVNADGNAIYFGTGDNADSYMSFAGRGFVGYDKPAAVDGALTFQGVVGKSVALTVNNGTFGSGALGLYVQGSGSPTGSGDIGNVGIGTNTPTEKLEVDGNIILSPDGGDNRSISFGNGFGNSALLLFESGSTQYGWGLNASEMQFFIPTGPRRFTWNTGSNGLQPTGTGELMRLESDTGNVGIGTDSPAEKLEVDGNILTSGTLELPADGTASAPTIFFTGDDDAGLYTNGNGGLSMSTDGKKRLEITASGNFFLEGSSVRVPSGSVASAGLRFGSNVSGLYRNSGSNIGMAINSAVSMFWDENLNVGIGTDTPAAKLDVDGNALISGTLEVADELTAIGQAFTDDNSVATKALIDELYGWDHTGQGKYGTFESGSGTTSSNDHASHINLGTTAGTNAGMVKIADGFNRSPFPQIGINSQLMPYVSRRCRVKFNINIVSLVGDARIWMWIGRESGTPSTLEPSDLGCGFWMDETNICAAVHDNTSYREGTPTPHGLSPIVANDFEIDFESGTCTVKINDVIFDSTSGTNIPWDVSGNFLIWCYSALGGAGNTARIEGKNLRSRFTTL